MDILDYLAIPALISGAGLVVWAAASHSAKTMAADAVTPSPANAKTSKKSDTSGRPTRPARQMRIADAATLFEYTQTSGLVAQIRQNMALDQGNFARDVMPLLNGLAEYVQLLPASESHHHAQPGGLLEHTLEVAAYALRLRQAQKLPLGAAPEDQMELGPVWSYGVLVAALLHDIGKPVADVVIDLYGTDVNRPLARWNGLGGAMNQAASRCKATHYTVDFPAQRDYKHHHHLPVVLIHALVPRSGLLWLSSNAALMTELMGYLNGEIPEESASAIRNLIKEADSLSVAANLATGNRTRFASARQTPLIERLMLGIRALVQEGNLSVNRPGAAMFIDPSGQFAWIVAKPAADKTRELLERRETLLAGAAGLPTDNTRIFDTWAEYGVLVQAPKEFGTGSVWSVRIDIEGWSQELTVLKFPMDALFVGEAKRPMPLVGAITPVAPSAVATRSTGSSEAKGQTTGAVIKTVETANTEAGAAIQTLATADLDTGAANLDFLNPAPEFTESNGSADPSELNDPRQTAAMAAGGDEDWDCDGIDMNKVLSVPVPVPATSAARSPVSTPAPNPIPIPIPTPATEDAVQYLAQEDDVKSVQVQAPQSPSKPVQAMPQALHQALPQVAHKPKGAQRKPCPNADAFMAWIQRGLGDGELNYNESDAVVHFVAEGMLMVTPRAFKRYLETNKFQGSIGEATDELRALQAEVQRSGAIVGNDASKFHYYRTTRRDGTPGANITCYLVPNPQAYLTPVPAPNAALVRAESKAEKKPALGVAGEPVSAVVKPKTFGGRKKGG